MALWSPPMNPYTQEHKELELLILSWYQDKPAKEKFIAQGRTFKVAVKAQKLKRTVVNVPKLIKVLGLKRIAELWEPPLSLIEREIPEDKLPLYIKEERSGPRALGTPVLIHPEAA